MIAHSPSWFVLSSEATADIGRAAFIPTVTLTALACLAVILRLYSRIRLTASRVQLEDCLIFVALMLSIGITIAVGEEFQLHVEHKAKSEDQPMSMHVMLELIFAQSIMYHLSINLVKASFVVLYIRLFALNPWIAYSCYTLLVLIAAAAAWGAFGNVFLCSPVQRYWDITARGICMDAEVHFWTTSLGCIVLNWAIWILPMPVLGHLRLPRRQKFGLMGCFGLGGFVCIASLLRLLLVQHAAHNGRVTQSGTYAIVFSTTEVNIGIMCASLLVMKPLFARFMPAFVTEPPMSATEDRRLWRALTGMHLLAGTTRDEEKAEHDGRRDTAIGMGLNSVELVSPEIALPEEAWNPEDRIERYPVR